MILRVLVLGAGFGGLELSSILSETIGDNLDLTSIDQNDSNNEAYNGAGSCYIEFGKGEVGRVDVDFFSGPKPVGIHHDASAALTIDKEYFGSSRKARWFGLP